jgi:hypothetical protein
LVIVSVTVQKLLNWCNSICQFLLLFPELLESDSENCFLWLYLKCFSYVFL